jgi:hypothetical protein
MLVFWFPNTPAIKQKRQQTWESLKVDRQKSSKQVGESIKSTNVALTKNPPPAVNVAALALGSTS